MIRSAPNLNQLWADLVVAELARCGADYFCLAPGSRCGPLTIAVASCARAKQNLHFDERGIAFHALGYGRATGRPAVAVTTSGTAVANLLPGVVEASEDRVPLIVLTADRPPEFHDAGANQTIEQVKIFGRYTRWENNIPCPTIEIKPESLLTTVDQAVYRARSAPQGPVHLNFMLREPLAPVRSGENYDSYLAGLSLWRQTDKPYTGYAPLKKTPGEETIRDLLKTLKDATRGVVVVGALRDKAAADAVARLAAKLGWPLLPDITSGLRLGAASRNTIGHYDHILAAGGLAAQHAPDAVLHLGGRLTSKRLIDYLESFRPNAYVHVDDHPFRYDPSHLARARIEADVDSFCGALSSRLAPKKGAPWVEEWRRAARIVDEAIADFAAKSAQLSEPLVARLVSQEIAAGGGLFLGSSMPVRDMNLFGAADGAEVSVAGNRGASGIDGTLATATGFARGLNRPVTLLIGDLALLHDLNSLALVRSLDKPMTIVVINNNGGGIFSFLPIARFEEVFERYFGTPHGLNFEDAARMFGLDYARPSSKSDFVTAYRKAAKKRKSALIEVVTGRKENYRLHAALQKRIAAQLSR